MTSGLPQVCKQWLVICKAMLPVRHLPPTILIAVNHCDHQLARMLGWVAPACHNDEGATQHPGACKHCLLYDRRPDGRFGVQVGTLGMWVV